MGTNALFNRLWAATLTLPPETATGIACTEGMSTSRFYEVTRPYKRPAETCVWRNSNLTEFNHKISVQTREFNDGRKSMTVQSRTQWPWGHERTCAQIPLPGIPLDKQSPSYRAVASVRFKPDAFPLEGFTITQKNDGSMEITTIGPFCNFNFGPNIYRDPSAMGTRSISLGNREMLTMDDDVADDLETQLIDGALNIVTELLEENTELPPNATIENLRARIRARLESKLPEGFVGGENIIRGRALLNELAERY